MGDPGASDPDGWFLVGEPGLGGIRRADRLASDDCLSVRPCTRSTFGHHGSDWKSGQGKDMDSRWQLARETSQTGVDVSG